MIITKPNDSCMGQSSLLSALVWNVPIRKIVTLGHFTNEIVAIIITN